jgi:hypothetical protein
LSIPPDYNCPASDAIFVSKGKTEMKKKNDVKFIIYQALYIFVICVIAVKGASIDLAEVELKKIIDPGWTYVDTSNKILIDKDELSKMIKFDSSQYLIVSKASYKPDPNNPPVNIAGLGPIQTPTTMNDPFQNTTKEPEQKHDPGSTPLPVLGNLQLGQYHDNPVTNKNGYDITVKGVTIPAYSTKTIRIEGDASVIVNYPGGSTTIGTTPNKKPEIKIQPITPMGENARASQLQRTTCFRVTISDDFADQLEVKFSGPVSVIQKDKSTYDITMNFFPSSEAFKNFADNRESPYHVGFNVIVKDKIAPHSVTSQQEFTFGDW